MLILGFYGLNLRFQGLKCMWWWCMAPLKGMVKKGRGFGIGHGFRFSRWSKGKEHDRSDAGKERCCMTGEQ